MKKLISILCHLVFWSWNLVFISVMGLWLLPQIGFDLLQDTRNGLVDPTFTVSFLILLIVPVICTVLGFLRLRNRPTLLMRLFYGVEAPLFTLCLLRLFLLRELTAASAFALGLVIFAILMFGVELLAGYAAYQKKMAWAQMIGHSLILVVGGYVGSLLLLYTVPALIFTIVGICAGIFQAVMATGSLFVALWEALTHPIESIDALVSMVLSLIVGLPFLFLFLSSFLVFLSMPYAFVHFYVRAWERIHQAFGKQHGLINSWAITGVTTAISIALFIGLQVQQPQAQAFDLLGPTLELASNPAQILSEQTIQSRQAQLANAHKIRKGLTNAYLYRYRYLSTWEDSNGLKDLYDYVWMPESAGRFLQTIHNALVSPFLYRGPSSDVEKAAQQYAQFFDAPIQKAEGDAIRKALQATANRDETKAGLLNLDQKIIRLASQRVSVEEHGDWATVEIQESYENNTPEDQEIFYSFSLPESAAISGLWLGTAEEPKLFPHVVSPRGAAQKVYNGEVERAKFQRATDPALLEQVGPRQYRLRVFPIPMSVPVVGNRHNREPGQLEMTLTYEVFNDGEGWPLPSLSEKRNIFWTKDTEYTRNDQSKRPEEVGKGAWFESHLPSRQRVRASAHSVSVADGYEVVATPLTDKTQQIPTGQKLAVVIDTSYSMAEEKAELKEAIAQLNQLKNQNSIDFYEAIAGQTKATMASNINVNRLMFYGTLQPADMLQQFVRQRDSKAYDAVLLLTDEGSYELAQDDAALPEMAESLWIVHMGNLMPSAYEDGLLDLIQTTQGGAETQVSAVLQKMAITDETATAINGYQWQVNQSGEDEADDIPTEEFGAIAARQLIRTQTQSLDTTQLAALDQVHEIAKQANVVTPYSSMLVLVDERQRELLREAEASADRFEREVEDGQDDLTQPGNPLQSASVPEPGQVLGLLVVAIALLSLKRKTIRDPDRAL
ncbi:MAG: TIGR02921 family PEP-CTERM protein [Cyanobacteria bacterium J06649_4]